MPTKKTKITTNFEFTLPRGLVDENGRIHRQGKMRLATARDEIIVWQDRRVKENKAYSILLYLAQVITRLGSLTNVTPQMLEDLTILDLAYLREFYNRINQHKNPKLPVQCPHCASEFQVELSLSGESRATLQKS